MKSKTLVLLLLLLLKTPCLTLAQKTKENTIRQDLSQARTYIKSGKNVEQAEKLMTDRLKRDSASRTDKRVFLTWYQAVQKQFDAANERLYLKQRQDTAAFFSLVRRMFIILEALDSLDMLPDKKGRVAPEYRSSHAKLLDGYRPNLFNGGVYHVRHDDYRQAYDYFEQYIDCCRQPLFTGYGYDSTDVRMKDAAYWATYCGSKMGDPVLTLRYRHRALADTARMPFTLRYMADARRQLKDDSLYVATLREGFQRFPEDTYFFPHLVDYYTSHQQYALADEAATRALEFNDSNALFLLAKSSVLLLQGRHRESISYSERLMAQNDSLPEPYFNMATAWLNIALKMDSRKERRQQRAAYQQARPYMERYRQIVPDGVDKWGPALYRIYLNLNLGKQFDEIDRLLKK